MNPIPSNPESFAAWADRECGAWPAELQATAYRAIVSRDQSEFRAAFEEWAAGY